MLREAVIREKHVEEKSRRGSLHTREPSGPLTRDETAPRARAIVRLCPSARARARARSLLSSPRASALVGWMAGWALAVALIRRSFAMTHFLALRPDEYYYTNRRPRPPPPPDHPLPPRNLTRKARRERRESRLDSTPARQTVASCRPFPWTRARVTFRNNYFIDTEPLQRYANVLNEPFQTRAAPNTRSARRAL